MGRALAARLGVAIAACLILPAAALAVGPEQRREGRAFFDVREGRPPAHPAGSARARLQLDRALGPQGVLDVDPLTGGPRVVAKLSGFLSEAAAGDPAQVALGYVRDHSAALGLGGADIDKLRLVRRYRTPDGVTHLTWAQTYHGIPAFDNELRANVAANGQVVSILGSPRGGLSVPSTRPRRSARQAVAAARRDAGARRKGRPIGRPRLVLFGEQGGARLAWRLRVEASPTQDYDYVVDASNAKVLRRANKVDFANALVWNFYPGSSADPSQHSVTFPGAWATSGSSLSGNNAHAYLDVNDDDVADSADEVQPVGGNFNFSFSAVSTGGICPVLGCTWYSPMSNSWAANEGQAATQAYWYANQFHDHLAAAPISFTPAAGNFEGSDKANVEVDDGAATGPDVNHINNANFSTPPDGQSPRMQMYLFGDGFGGSAVWPDVNGADDASIVYHEYTHGLSNRLITDSSGYGALDTSQAGAMGEAWSDWYAFDYLAEQGYVSDTSTNGDIQAGSYEDSGNHLIRYQGINCPVGSSAASGCPGSIGAGEGGFTYADFGRVDSQPEVHSDGEIWGETLWDLRQKMLTIYPSDGAQRTEMLVTHAMELAPPQPSFLDMRNAILQEDQIAYAGADQTAIWQAFANRGMGWFASTTDSSDPQPVADFSTPPSGGGTVTVSGHVSDYQGGRPVVGATVRISGTGLVGSTDALGAYSIAGVPSGSDPPLIASAPGYDRQVESVSFAGGQNAADFWLRRDWASSSGGAYVRAFSGPDYSLGGCGPGHAIDQSQGTGWSTDAGTDQSIVVALPQAVDASGFGIDPAGVCGDGSGSALKSYDLDVSRDGSNWSHYTSGSFGIQNVGYVNTVWAHGGSGTRYVRLTMHSNQAGSGAGTYMDVAELEVYGRPPIVIQPPVPPPPPTGPTDTSKPTPGFSVNVAVGARQKLKTLLKRGLPVELTCSSRCTGAAALKLKRKALGAALRELIGGGKGRLVVRVSKKAARKSLGKGKKWKLDLRIVVTGPQGRRSFTKPVTVSR